jgi:hypothetical protein
VSYVLEFKRRLKRLENLIGQLGSIGARYCNAA